MSTTRRPLGLGPVPPLDHRMEQAGRGRTAAEQAANENPQQFAPGTAAAPVGIRRRLGVGPGIA
ncbi:hypothetical protein [Streptomyces erythrochromogenes]|uniref:hypothetical protein n=1 Tax=Streptomyces erythrochromogenes TaxID=285574 RepID=UPI0036830C8C